MNMGVLFSVFPTDELWGASWSQQVNSEQIKGGGSSHSMDQSCSVKSSLEFRDRLRKYTE